MTRASPALENAALRQQLTIYQRNQKHPASNRGPCLLGRSPQALVRLGAGADRRQARDRDRLAPARIQADLASPIRGASAVLGFPASTSPSSDASRATIPSGARTRSPRSSTPSSESTIPRARSGATWSGEPMDPARPRPGTRSFRTTPKRSGPVTSSPSTPPFSRSLYVFVIMEVGSRRIVHFNVTTNPTPPWVDHFIFLSIDHVRRTASEFIRYDNGARPSQAIQRIPDPYPELKRLRQRRPTRRAPGPRRRSEAAPAATGLSVTVAIASGVFEGGIGRKEWMEERKGTLPWLWAGRGSSARSSPLKMRRDGYLRLLQAKPASPRSAVPTRRRLPGSGTSPIKSCPSCHFIATPCPFASAR